MNNAKNNGAANSNSKNNGGNRVMAGSTIRTMEAFAEAVKRAMEAVYGSGYSISVRQVTKNNDTQLTGLFVVRQGSTTAPVIYLESLFARHQEGMALEAVCM